MNTQPSAVPQAPAAMSPTRPLYWSVRRELWENRFIYLVPLASAAAFLAISMLHLPASVRAMAALDPIHQREALEEPYDYAGFVIMGTAIILGMFYCLEALHGDRRDRSVLFWKSLPVSDLTTVLAKASIPFFVLPLLASVLIAATQFIMLLLGTAVLLSRGQGATMLWTPWFLQMLLMMIYHLWAVHIVWQAPIYGWLLLVSSWARRAVLLWAVLPPLAIGFLEKFLFNTTHFGEMVGYRFIGPASFPSAQHHSGPMNPFATLGVGYFLTAPGLWIGLAVTAAFLAAAVRLRRYRGPI